MANSRLLKCCRVAAVKPGPDCMMDQPVTVFKLSFNSKLIIKKKKETFRNQIYITTVLFFTLTSMVISSLALILLSNSQTQYLHFWFILAIILLFPCRLNIRSFKLKIDAIMLQSPSTAWLDLSPIVFRRLCQSRLPSLMASSMAILDCKMQSQLGF